MPTWEEGMLSHFHTADELSSMEGLGVSNERQATAAGSCMRGGGADAEEERASQLRLSEFLHAHTQELLRCAVGGL
eukprot:scaffold66356_cov25-Tisochrysis_lutea.AAC.1